MVAIKPTSGITLSNQEGRDSSAWWLSAAVQSKDARLRNLLAEIQDLSAVCALAESLPRHAVQLLACQVRDITFRANAMVSAQQTDMAASGASQMSSATVAVAGPMTAKPGHSLSPSARNDSGAWKLSYAADM